MTSVYAGINGYFIRGRDILFKKIFKFLFVLRIFRILGKGLLKWIRWRHYFLKMRWSFWFFAHIVCRRRFVTRLQLRFCRLRFAPFWFQIANNKKLIWVLLSYNTWDESANVKCKNKWQYEGLVSIKIMLGYTRHLSDWLSPCKSTEVDTSRDCHFKKWI